MKISVKKAIKILRERGFRAKKGSKPGTVKFLAHYINLQEGVYFEWLEIPSTEEAIKMVL